MITSISALNAAETSENVDLLQAGYFSVENGSIEMKNVNGKNRLIWNINAGQTSKLSIRKDHPLLKRLRYFDRFNMKFNIVSGSISTADLWMYRHVSGARQYKVHQWQIALFSTQAKIWHQCSFDTHTPNWMPWDQKDGPGTEPYLRLEALAVEENTSIAIEDMTLSSSLIRLKPDFEYPVTWPILTKHKDGSATYMITHYLHNVAGLPTQAKIRVNSNNKMFDIGLFDGIEAPELPVAEFKKEITLDLKHAEKSQVYITAHISPKNLKKMKELSSERLEIAISTTMDPDNISYWQTELTRPLSDDINQQVLIEDEQLAYIRKAVSENDEGLKKRLGLANTLKIADILAEAEFMTLPRSKSHVRNGYIGNWRPTNRMPEIIDTKTGEKQFGTYLAGRTWKEYLAHAGKGCESLTLAYLYTGNEKYAAKAIELFKLYAQQYSELTWATLSDVPWYTGSPILCSSRVAVSSTYGTNMYFKWHCRLLLAITQSKFWTEELRNEIYIKFVLPYALELMKFPGGVSNMTDVTNQNLFLLGLAFKDANIVRFALLSDPGVLRRLDDITADGFSSEGRPINYHFAAMEEYLPTIGYISRSGLDVEINKKNLAAAVRMPFQRATLNGTVPLSGDSARGYSMRATKYADEIYEFMPEEWLKKAGSGTTLSFKIKDEKPEKDAWKSLLETKPILFKDAGLAILRTGDTIEDQIMVTLDYGKNVFHAHLDRNQITLMAFGKIFSQGPGSLYNVGSGGIEKSNNPKLKSFCTHGSLGQNVILIDQLDQDTVIGELLAWSDKTDFQLAASKVDNIKPGVNHTRLVVLTKCIIVMLDKIESDTKHDYDFVYHNLGSMALGKNWSAEPADSIGNTANFDNIIDLKQLKGSGPLSLTWDLTDNLSKWQKEANKKKNIHPSTVKLDFQQLPVKGAEFYTGITGMNNNDTRRMPDTAPTIIQRVKGAETAFFASVMSPYKEKSPVRSIKANGNDGISITLENGENLKLNLSDLLKKYGVR